MRSKHPATDCLEDILENVERIENYVRGLDRGAFRKDGRTRDAVERCLERICEAAFRLGDRARELMPEQPWNDIRGMGNRLRHAYDRVSFDTICDAVYDELPSLKADAQRVLTLLNLAPRMTKAAILGIAGLALSAAEAALFRACPPAGIILFGRNVADPSQLAGLTASLREVLPAEAVLMVDQEGGRVARLRPPHWRAHPPAGAIGRLYEARPEASRRAAWLSGALIGLECRTAGFDVVTAPVLDRRVPAAHDVIGDRAYAENPETVGVLGAAMAAGLLTAGVQPVAKHIPGHGRAQADSHLELPRVTATDLDADFRPFLMNRALPWAMTAHVLYTALDAERPATLSPTVIGRIIRERIGFSGVLISDDLAMGALSGEPAARATAALAAGCDLALYCAGDLAANEAVLTSVPDLAPRAADRMRTAAERARARHIALDLAALAAEREELLA